MRLRRERVLPLATDLLAQFNPGKPTLDASIRALQLLAEDIAPQLGWVRARPARGRRPAHPPHISTRPANPLAPIGRS